MWDSAGVFICLAHNDSLTCSPKRRLQKNDWNEPNMKNQFMNKEGTLIRNILKEKKNSKSWTVCVFVYHIQGHYLIKIVSFYLSYCMHSVYNFLCVAATSCKSSQASEK